MKNRPRRYLLYLLLRGAMALIRVMPRSWALGFARAAGRVAFYLVGRQRKKVLEHLRFAWKGEKSEAELKEIGRKVFENLALTAVDTIRFPSLNKNNLREWVIYDDEFLRIKRILDEGQGALLLGSHIGNWELSAAAFGLMGYMGGGAVVGRRIYYEKYNQIITGLRESVGIRTIYRDESPKEMLRILKNNRILGMLADQDVGSVDGVFVDFLGHPAYTPTAPVKLAMAAETVIVPAFMIREGNRYRLILEEPIMPKTVKGSREETVREFTQQWSRVVEKYIRRYPEQWVWMHNRWKTSPEDVSAAERKGVLK